MQTKSNIQLIRERLAVREEFESNLKSLMEKYIVEDSYFSQSKIDARLPEENIKGYFVFNHEYGNLNEAVINMGVADTIRIIDNKRFQVGRVYEKLSDAKGERVFDITTGLAVQDE